MAAKLLQAQLAPPALLALPAPAEAAQRGGVTLERAVLAAAGTRPAAAPSDGQQASAAPVSALDAELAALEPAAPEPRLWSRPAQRQLAA